MTEVEAIERVLKGEPFKDCMHCDGMGTTPASRQRYKNAVLLYEQSTPRTRVQLPQAKDYTQLCMRCKGRGTAVEDTYAEACRVLNREPPNLKMSFDAVMHNIQDRVLNSERMQEVLKDFKDHVDNDR